MNVAQFLLQLRTTAAALLFPGTATLVFASGDVRIGTAGDKLSLEAKDENVYRSSLVFWLEDAQADAEHPRLLEATIKGRIKVSHVRDGSDPTFELRDVSRSTTTPGIYPVAEQTLAAFEKLGKSSGLIMQSAMSGVERVGNEVSTSSLTFSITAFLTTSPSFPTHQGFRITAQTTSSITLAWKRPAARYDSVVQVLRYATGSAPATSTDGTGVVVGATDTSVTVSGLSSGTTYYFSLFMGYDTAWPLAGSAGEFVKVTTSGATS